MDKKKSFLDLVKVIDELREKCPWDKKQTKNSLRSLTIEECYELSDAILNDKDEEIKKELGDILTHIIFYSKIFSEKNIFTIDDVINNQIEKLIRRHPHIYGESTISTEKEVKKNWEAIKLNESSRKSVLEGVPKSLPTLLKSWRILEKVGDLGFQWNNKIDYIRKIDEELLEFKTELSKKNKIKIDEEFGDFLFSIINYGRFLGINPVDSLEKTNKKFITRFKYMEHLIKSDNKKIENLSNNELELYWNRSKNLQ
tara:strand:- start:2200 stop:2967 length:768 start_codon:yes stop_codon:yes gene_type:complete